MNDSRKTDPNPQQTIPQQLQQKKRFRRILLINSFLVVGFAWFGFAKDSWEMWDTSQRNRLEIKLTPNKRVTSGQIITMNYTAPITGYLSLWNWNSQGEIKNVLPVHSLNTENSINKLTVKADTKSGMEQMIMLWTPESSGHPDEPYYKNDAMFSGEVSMLPDVEMTDAQVYVYHQ